jgi:hypothetical protein
MPVIPIFLLLPALRFTVEQFERLIATKHLHTAPYFSTSRLQSRSMNAGQILELSRTFRHASFPIMKGELYERPFQAGD